MANRNRTAGNNYERQIVNELKDLDYDVATSRSESRNADNAGIDIVGNFPYHIQCKVYQHYPKLDELINNDRPERFQDKPIIVFHKKVRKANTKFITQDEFVSLRKEDFIKLIVKANAS
jgi:Holliday junction resolvase